MRGGMKVALRHSMRQRRRWFPHAALSIVMWLLWLLLANDITGGHVILGAFLAWLIPYATQSFWPEALTVHKPWLALKFLAVVLWDVVIANFQVARLVLGPVKRVQPAFMIIPLDVKEDITITLLANTISLTPGTVAADLAVDRSHLIVHSLHVTDMDAAVAQIKRRYEAPLKDIFE